MAISPGKKAVALLAFVAITILIVFLVKNRKPIDEKAKEIPTVSESLGEVKPPIQINPPGGDDAEFKRKAMELRNRHNIPEKTE